MLSQREPLLESKHRGTTEYLRVDLGSSRSVGHVAYEPRVMVTEADGSWNGVYRLYEIYVTDDAGGNPANWGAPVATGEWLWPNLQERRDVYFTPKTGRYVYYRRISSYGWYIVWGYPGYASANEIWVYEQSGTWSLASETRYMYDGKRVIQERDGSNVPLVTYTRGNDLSGSLEGAGGIGGLLARSHGYTNGNWSTHSFYHADGNGNITCLADAAQAIAAGYKYDAYGRTLNSSGTLAAANVYRFSSKEFHANTGLYYYLYRFYDPNTQRWMNRDPATELGFAHFAFKHIPHVGRHTRKPSTAKLDYRANLVTFVVNCPVSYVDRYGLQVANSANPVGEDEQETMEECWSDCMNQMVPVPLRIFGCFTGLGALAAKAAGATTASELLLILPVWASGCGVGCWIGCAAVLGPPLPDTYPPAY